MHRPASFRRRPPPPRYPQGWSIGTPDIVYEMPDPFVVQAEGTVPIQRFRVPTNLKKTSGFRPPRFAPATGRSSITSASTSTTTRSDNASGRGSKTCWRPTRPATCLRSFRPGSPRRIPPGSELLFEVHYTPIGKSRFDRSTIGLIVAKKPPEHLAHHSRHRRLGPARSPHEPPTTHESGVDDRARHPSPQPLPHMHLRGKSFKFTAQYPDGHLEILLSVPHYDFNWQSVYRLVEPKALPKGTLIQCDAEYDNSSRQPGQPRSRQDRPLGRANLGRDDDRIHRLL